MLLKEIARFSLQHRTLYCYLILSIWIFLLIAGMYKYIGSIENGNNLLSAKSFGYRKTESYLVGEGDPAGRHRIKEINQTDCTHPFAIVPGEEGGSLEGWTLQGVLLLIRHGDRGPMAHVRGINEVDCGYENDLTLARYINFLQNTTTSSTSGGHWMKTGPFHGFPLLPAAAKVCLLAQLTQKGIAQMLHVGDIVRQAYANALGLYARVPMSTQRTTPYNGSDGAGASNPTSGFQYVVDDVVIYSTRYRRTFQSAMALLFGMLPPEKWLAMQIQESHSLSYCFADCACPQAEKLKKQLANEMNGHLAKHPAIGAIVQWIGAALLQNPQAAGQQINPFEIRDALLAHICHGAPLPCRKIHSNVQAADGRRYDGSSVPVSSTQDPLGLDVINIDLDEPTLGGGGGSGPSINTEQPDDSDTTEQEPEIEGCVEKSHVLALMSYIHWAGMKELYSQSMRQQGLLRSYGLMRNIVAYMLRMISGDRVKFVLYSGHDKTIEYLIASLGVQLENPFIPYASRMAFEVYKSDKDTQYYFRLVYNGRDVTNTIDVCESGKSLNVPRGIRGGRGHLCPIENIIRFIHDDYFLSLNATNYKDACLAQTKQEGFF
ncbi:2-phosphoxylose phosphatase 1 [Anopheles maculipalpis]|uniref:2-phosphoxylose phosphatase 1 n=1 Tax=Anopheles maculipalpis TaxID=1496333 RepID=UPI00215919E9|nr:2-phosphoxylose phosphatase 1 [Anopheles maculipalpis]